MPTGGEHSYNSDNPLILKELVKDSKTTDSGSNKMQVTHKVNRKQQSVS